MTANVSTDNVTAAKPKVGGCLFRAPIGTELPTDAKTAIDEAFTSLGYISEDALENGKTLGDVVKAWGGDVVLRKSGEDSFTCTLIESINPEVLKLVHGSNNVSGTIESGITVKVGDPDIEKFCYVVEMVLKGDILKRVVIPQAAITEIGEVKYGDDEVVGYQVTLTAEKDTDGFSHYEYICKQGG